MSLHSGDLRSAIEQLRPELPQLLGPNHPTFEVELETILLGGTDNQLLDLFGRYPDAHERLLDILDQQRGEEETVQRETEVIKGLGSSGLFGDISIFWPNPPYYHCKSGPHIVALGKVEKRDATGRAICPQHDIVMSQVKQEDVKAAIERLRPELPQILGTDSATFVTKLDTLLPDWDSDQIMTLFHDHPPAYQRLLQMLVQGPLAK